jgi:hypothetical protein
MQGAAPTKTTFLQCALVTPLTNDPLSRHIFVSLISTITMLTLSSNIYSFSYQVARVTNATNIISAMKNRQSNITSLANKQTDNSFESE